MLIELGTGVTGACRLGVGAICIGGGIFILVEGKRSLALGPVSSGCKPEDLVNGTFLGDGGRMTPGSGKMRMLRK